MIKKYNQFIREFVENGNYIDAKMQELKDLVNLQNEINDLLLNIGNIELVKNQLVNKHYELQIVWKTMTNSLEEKYGSVSINLENGLFTSNEG
jgi:hypothetical protein